MKTSVKWLFASVLAVVGAWVVHGVLKDVLVFARSSVNRPATIEGKEVLYNQDGSIRLQKNFVRGYRADGSVAEIKSFPGPDGRPAEIRKIRDLATGASVTVDSMTASKTSMTLNQVAERHRPTSACQPDSSAEKATFLGFQVFRGVRDSPSLPGLKESSSAKCGPRRS